MKKTQLLLLVLLVSSICYAQDVAWLNTVGGTNFDSASKITTDNDNNIYVVGTFRETIDIDPGTGIFEINQVSPTGESEYLQKLDSDGNFIWGFALGTTEYFDIYNIKIADNGTIFVVGVFSNTIDLDPGTGTFLRTSEGLRDGFILVLNSDGSFNNAHTLGSIENDYAIGVAIANNGNILITGSALETVDFDPGPGVANITTDQGYGFILTLSPTFQFIDVFSFGAGGVIIAYDVSINSDEDIVVGGYFSGTADFDPSAATFELTSNGQNDFFIAKYDLNNQLLWAVNFGNDEASGYTSMMLDTNDDIYVTGRFYGTMDMDPGNDISNITSNGDLDLFITKLDTEGQFIWAYNFGNPISHDRSWSMAVNSHDEVIISGQFQETVDFDPGENIFNLTSNGIKDAFLLSLDSNGDFLSAFSMGGYAVDAGVCVAVDNQDALILGGTFRLIADLQPGSGTNNVTSNGDADAFVIKLNNLILGVDNNTISTSEIVAYPNPSTGIIHLNVPNASSAINITISNLLGQVVLEQKFPQGENIELRLPEANGMYLCNVVAGNASQTIKLIKE